MMEGRMTGRPPLRNLGRTGVIGSALSRRMRDLTRLRPTRTVDLLSRSSRGDGGVIRIVSCWAGNRAGVSGSRASAASGPRDAFECRSVQARGSLKAWGRGQHQGLSPIGSVPETPLVRET